MHGLDRGRHSEPGEPLQVGRVDQLDVLDPGAKRPRSGPWLQRIEGGPKPCIADRMDLGHDPAAGRPLGQLGQPIGLRDPDPALAPGLQRPVRLECERLEQRGRPGAERPVGEQLLPAHPGPAVGIPADRHAAPIAALDGDGDGLLAEADVRPDREPSRVGQPGVRGEGPLEGRVGDEAAGVVDRDDPERNELAAERRDGRGELVRGRRRRQVAPRAGRPTRGGSRSAGRPGRAGSRRPPGLGCPRRRPPPGAQHGSPIANGDRGPRARPGGRALPARGRRRWASHPSDPTPSRVPATILRDRLPGPPLPRSGAAPSSRAGSEPRSTWLAEIAALARWR